MKLRFVAQLLLLLAGCLRFPHSVHAEIISSFNASYRIGSNGEAEVTERILYDFGAEYRHGIYRTIPYVRTNMEGKKFETELSGFTVTDGSGTTYPFSESVTGEEKQLKIGDKNRTVNGSHLYEIGYTIRGGLTYFSDHDELYWNITGNGWDYPIGQAKAEITLPKIFIPQDVRTSCFTGATGSFEHNCSVDYSSGTVTVASKGILASREGLTLVVGFPKGAVAVLEPKPYVPFWDTWAGKTLIIIMSIAAALWYVVLPVSIPVNWWKNGRDPKPVIGEASSWFDPPKMKDGTPLTPGETGTLTDEVVHMRDITATIIHLAQRGFLKISEPEKGSFILKRLTNSVWGDKLRSHEQRLVEDMFGAIDVLQLKTAKLADTVEKAKTDLYNEVVLDGFFLKNPQAVRNGHIILAVVGLITGNLGLLVSALAFGLQMPKKTQYGSEQAAVARSLRNFLTSQERQLTFQAKNQMFFEKLLPYAVAFGVEKIWAKRFDGIQMRQPEWYQGYSRSNFNSVLFVSSLGRSASSFTQAATPVTSSTGHSSGFSGGFSGGGGGGGGGGSW